MKYKVYIKRKQKPTIWQRIKDLFKGYIDVNEFINNIKNTNKNIPFFTVLLSIDGKKMTKYHIWDISKAYHPIKMALLYQKLRYHKNGYYLMKNITLDSSQVYTNLK